MTLRHSVCTCGHGFTNHGCNCVKCNDDGCLELGCSCNGFQYAEPQARPTPAVGVSPQDSGFAQRMGEPSADPDSVFAELVLQVVGPSLANKRTDAVTDEDVQRAMDAAAAHYGQSITEEQKADEDYRVTMETFRVVLEDFVSRRTTAGQHRNEDAVTCRGCFRKLDAALVGVADGCPCNSPRGINHGLVPPHICTCSVCDPAQTGAVRHA